MSFRLSAVAALALLQVLGGCTAAAPTDDVETDDSALEASAWAYDPRCTFADGISSGCSGGVNHDGPGGGAYPCVADAYTFAP